MGSYEQQQKLVLLVYNFLKRNQAVACPKVTYILLHAKHLCLYSTAKIPIFCHELFVFC